MLGKWASPARLPETRALKVSALDQVIEVRTLEGQFSDPDVGQRSRSRPPHRLRRCRQHLLQRGPVSSTEPRTEPSLCSLPCRRCPLEGGPSQCCELNTALPGVAPLHAANPFGSL